MKILPPGNIVIIITYVRYPYMEKGQSDRKKTVGIVTVIDGSMQDKLSQVEWHNNKSSYLLPILCLSKESLMGQLSPLLGWLYYSHMSVDLAGKSDGAGTSKTALPAGLKPVLRWWGWLRTYRQAFSYSCFLISQWISRRGKQAMVPKCLLGAHY